MTAPSGHPHSDLPWWLWEVAMHRTTTGPGWADGHPKLYLPLLVGIPEIDAHPEREDIRLAELWRWPFFLTVGSSHAGGR